MAYLFQRKRRPNEATPPPPPPAGEYELRFRWLRGPESPVCSSRECPIANDFSPLMWSNFARKDSWSLQCVDESMGLRMGLDGKAPIFCSADCFRQAWRDAVSHNQPFSGEGRTVPRLSGVSSEGGGRLPSEEEERASSTRKDIQGDECESGMASGDWIEVCTERRFRPCAADVGRRFRLECTAVSLDGSHLFGPRSIQIEPVLASPPPPPKRNLITVKGASNGGGYRFRVVSYNLLAEIYATGQMYPLCDFWALGWGYRCENLLRELRDSSADVMCLQEVQADHFEMHLKPRLYELGFEGLYKQKAREAMGMAGKVDGCAIFWRRSKFRLAEQYGVEFNTCARTVAQQIAESDEHEREILNRLTKDNIGVVVVLEVLLPNTRQNRINRMGPMQVCIANTHLYSNKDFPDVKLWQCHNLVRELEQLVCSRDLPLIICGKSEDDV